jgi:bla regulator protein BlaR1
MLAWMEYAIAVSLLLSIAALAAGQVASARRASGRWIWTLAIAGSLVLPTAIPSVSVTLPAVFTPGGAAKQLALRDMTSAALMPSTWVPRQAEAAATAVDIDLVLRRAWMLMSGGLLGVYAASAAYLSWRKRHWREASMAGMQVCVSADIGPAVVGLLRPQIVVPGWLGDLPVHQQRLVLAHEQSHLDAGDSRLLALSLLLLAAMPWNLPLWWQWRRLRQAIEIDCDARVLGQGHDVQLYGTALIDIGARGGAFAGAATAMVESASLLERRIRIMVGKPSRWTRRAAPAAAVFALSMVALAAELGPPGAGHRDISLPLATLQTYAGYYQVGENKVMVVSPSGTHLVASVNAERRLELLPESDTTFFVRGQDLEIRFLRPATGQAASGLVMRVAGVDFQPSPRVDAQAMQRVDQFVQQRVAGQTAAPGGEDALRRNLDLIADGKIEGNDFSPETARIVRRVLPSSEATLHGYGMVRAIHFSGVDRAGWDSYRVRYEHGELTWYLWMNSSGKVARFFFRKDV